jgi:hypothetical protein
MEMSEASGKKENLREVLRELFSQYFKKFPSQKYSHTMHVELDIAVPIETPFYRLISDQLENCWRSNRKRSEQRETQLRFRGRCKAGVTCFMHKQ